MASFASIVARLQNPDAWVWRGVVEDLIPDGVTIAFGASGSRKTFIATNLAVRVAAGLSFGNYKTQLGLVVYIATEALRGLEKRIYATTAALGLLGRALPIEVIGPPCAVTSTEFAPQVTRLVQQVEKNCGQRCALVILDTLGATCRASLNEDHVANAAMDALLSLSSNLGGASVVAIHHTGKDETRDERGSKVLRDRADASIRITKAKSSSVCEVLKQREDEDGQKLLIDFAPFSFQPAQGVTYRTLFVDNITSERADAAPQKPLRANAQAVLDALVKITSVPGYAGSAPLEEWRTAAAEKLGKSNSTTARTAFHKAKALLFARGLVVEAPDGFSVPSRSQSVPVQSEERVLPFPHPKGRERENAPDAEGADDGRFHDDGWASSDFTDAEPDDWRSSIPAEEWSLAT